MTRPIELIISQGRVGDRTGGAIPGALKTGHALSRMLGIEPLVVGTAAPAQEDDWSECLPAAEETLHALRDAVRDAFDRDATPVLATNTCGASIGTLPTLAERFPDAVVLWIDAHGDFNTPETTGSGYLGGMVVAAACGLWDSGHGAGLNPKQVVIVGGRDIDPDERTLLDQHGVTVLPPSESTPARIDEIVAGRDVWIHVDWDVLQPGYIPAAYRVDAGMLPHEIAAIFAAIDPARVRGVELAEFEDGDQGIPSHLSVELILETFQALRLGGFGG
ncbi:arginase family protein [Microbacterium sp. NPDC089987]|uniref:arginase family protein n=1 Tax=Microbacterium sp. NPDC089987 TaxID=3364202 RepID=UPI00380956C4